MNSPTDFSGIMDAIKITSVIKYLAALKSSQGFLRASAGFLQPKALCGFQGLICSPSVVQMLTAMLCHRPLQQPGFISETTDLGWEADKGESMALHVSLLFFWWMSSTARLAGSVTCDALADAASGLQIRVSHARPLPLFPVIFWQGRKVS